MVEINSNLQVNNLEAWQGSFGTGAGYIPTPRRKKEEEKPEREAEPKEGVTKDDSGVVHVDLVA
jgi:hypothetical protein